MDVDPSDLKRGDLEWSTIVPQERKFNQSTNRGGGRHLHKCILCGRDYCGGPREIRSHLNKDEPCRLIKLCVPKDDEGETKNKDRLKLVAAELEKRRQADEFAKSLAISPRKRPHAAEAIISDSGGAACAAAADEENITVESVHEDWACAFAANALSFQTVSEQHFRTAVRNTAKLGEKYLKSDGKDSRLPQRTAFVEGPITTAGEKVERRVRQKTKKTGENCGGVVVSDGWDSTQHRPIINVLYTTITGTKFLCALDTTGDSKDMRYIADLVVQQIKELGANIVTAVCMDGACSGAFKYIEAEIKHITCFICPTHSLNNFMSDICSSKISVKVKGQRSITWGEDLFEKPIEDIWTVVKAVTGAQKPLAVYRRIKDVENNRIATHGNADTELYKELLKFCETRFASKILMSARYRLCRPIIDILLSDTEFIEWLSLQKAETREKWAEVKRIVRSEEHAERVATLLRVFVPCVEVMRLTDGKKGVTLGKFYAAMLGLGGSGGLYARRISGVDKLVRTKMLQVFMARWEYFHSPLMTAAYMLDPQYIRRTFTAEEEGELRRIMKKLAGAHPTFTHENMIEQYGLARTEMLCESGEFVENGAAWRSATTLSPVTWAEIYLYKWKDLQWIAKRLGGLSASASPCEHSWSIEGWIHSARRNRMEQRRVEHMVRFHSNLVLEKAAKEWEDNAFLWEDEMAVSEPAE